MVTQGRVEWANLVEHGRFLSDGAAGDEVLRRQHMAEGGSPRLAPSLFTADGAPAVTLMVPPVGGSAAAEAAALARSVGGLADQMGAGSGGLTRGKGGGIVAKRTLPGTDPSAVAKKPAAAAAAAASAAPVRRRTGRAVVGFFLFFLRFSIENAEIAPFSCIFTKK